MHKQMLVLVLGIFSLITTILSKRVVFDDDNEQNLHHQVRNKVFLGSSVARGMHESMDDDRLINKLMDSLKRRTSFSRYQTLEHNTRDFSTEQIQFQKSMLQAHNNYRSCHGVPPLQLDDKLSLSAQNYAETLAFYNEFQHSGTPGTGENLWMMWSSGKIKSVDGAIPTSAWYNEIKSYDFSIESPQPAAGHFTQVVWKSSRNLGVGIAFSTDRSKAYAVAQYTPPGNYKGQYGQNVFPPQC